MKKEKMINERIAEQDYIERIIPGEYKEYETTKFELHNNVGFEITSKFTSEAVIEYAFKNNLKDLEKLAKEKPAGYSKLELDLMFDTFSEYDEDHVKEHIDWIHLFSGHVLITRANKEVGLEYMRDLEDYLKALSVNTCHLDEFECTEQGENSIRIFLADYPNDSAHSLSEAISGIIMIYRAVAIFNNKYGIEDYDIKIFLDSHEM